MIIAGIILVVVGILFCVSPKLLKHSRLFGMFLSQLKWHIVAPGLGLFLAGAGVASIVWPLIIW